MSQKRKSLYNKMVDISKGDEWYKYCVPFDNHPILDFPLRLAQGYTMYEYLKIIFNKYYKLLEKVEKIEKAKEGDEISNKIIIEIKVFAEELGDAILDSLRKYYNGNTIAAFENLKDKLSSCLKDIIVENNIDEGQSFYRMRAETNLNSARDFFHTPFNKRYFCGPQRFSVPGYPTLYVAYSKSCCMLEMEGYHSLGEFQYEGKGNIHLVDLTFNPPIGDKKAGQQNTDQQNTDQQELYQQKLNQQREKEEKRFLKFWPLIAACYVVNTVPENIDKRQAKFREEYIIPQLLSLYVKENLVKKGEIWGIRYYTVNNGGLDPEGQGENDYRNIMFFTEYDEDSPTPYDMKLMNNFKFMGSKQV